MRRRLTIEIYSDKGGRWRWRLVARNGRKQAVSGESFSKKGNAVRAAWTINNMLVTPAKLVF